MIVYSNSCSFGAVQGHTIYPDVVAENVSAQLINRGANGSCNRRIIRTTLRDLNELKSKDNVLLLLGLTFISRTEIWRSELSANNNDGHFYSIRSNYSNFNWSLQGLVDTIVPNIHEHTDPNVKDYYREWLAHFNPEAEVTNLLTDILMLTGWCKSNNIQYVVFSNVDFLPDHNKVGYTSPFLHSLRTSVEQDPNIINPWEFSFSTYALDAGFIPKDSNLFGKHGHPDKDAHVMFGNYLIDHIRKNNTL